MEERPKLPATMLLRLTSLKELFGGFAHEIAQPLNAIIIAAQVIQLKLQQTSLPHEDMDFFMQRLDLVTSQVQRATEIVERLRRFNQDSPSPALRNDLPAVCERLFDLMRQQFVARGIDVIWKSEHPEPPSPVDPVLAEGVIVQALAFVRDTVQALGVWHDKSKIPFKKSVTATRKTLNGHPAIRLEWQRGEYPPREYPLDPDLQPGLLVARSVVISTGGTVEVNVDSLTLTFPPQE